MLEYFYMRVAITKFVNQKMTSRCLCPLQPSKLIWLKFYLNESRRLRFQSAHTKILVIFTELNGDFMGVRPLLLSDNQPTNQQPTKQNFFVFFPFKKAVFRGMSHSKSLLYLSLSSFVNEVFPIYVVMVKWMFSCSSLNDIFKNN